MLNIITYLAIALSVLALIGLVVAVNKLKTQKSITTKSEKQLSNFKEEYKSLKNIADNATSLEKKFEELKMEHIKMEEDLKNVSSELQDTSQKFDKASKEKLEVTENFEFVSSVLNAQPELDEGFNEFLQLLENDFSIYANKNDALAEEVAALLALQNLRDELQLVVSSPVLYKKNIIALGGGFSCGKSSFINSLLETRDITLPTGVNPVTAIPAYVVAGSSVKVIGPSHTGGKISITKDFFKKFTHDRLKAFPFNIKSILPYITVDTKLSSEFEHLCFIDTPGYNPGTQSDSDMQASVDFIKRAKALIWVITVEAGTLPNDDINMLQKILDNDPDKKIFVVCNKSDLKSESEVASVCAEIANQLDLMGIPYEGIIPYASSYSYNNQAVNNELEMYGLKTTPTALQDFFKSLNFENTTKANELVEKIREVFSNYITADMNEINRLVKHKTILNKINLDVFSVIEKKDSEISYYKARIDKSRFTDRKNYNSELEDKDDYIVNIAEMIGDYTARIDKYEEDIEEAKKLCEKMQKSICKIFNIRYDHNWEPKYNAPEKIVKNGVKFCTQCGEQQDSDAKFCHQCGFDLSEE